MVEPTPVEAGVFDEAKFNSRVAAPQALGYDNRTHSERITDNLAYAAPSAIAGFFDTVGQSVGILDEDTLKDYLKSTVGNFGDYYERNRETAQMVGDFAGMFVPGMLALKAMRTGSYVHKMVMAGSKSNKVLDSIFASGKSYGQLLRGVQTQDLHLARQGVGELLSNPARKASVARAMRTKVADTIKETAAFEFGVLSTMSESDVLYPDEFTIADHIMLGGGAAGVFVGAEWAFMRAAIRRSAAKVAPIAAKARQHSDIPAEDAIFRPGFRDTGITIYALEGAMARQELSDVMLKPKMAAKGPEIRADVLNNQIISYETVVKTQLQKLGLDSPYQGVTSKTNFGDKSLEIKGMQNALKLEPTAMLGVLSAEHMPSTLDDIHKVMQRKDKRIVSLQKNMTKKLDEIAAMSADEFEVGGSKINSEVTAMQQEMDEVKSLLYFVNEADGTLSHARLRKPIAQDLQIKVKKHRATQLEPARYSVDMPTPKLHKGPRVKNAVTEDFIWLMPPVKAKLTPAEELLKRSGLYRASQEAIEQFPKGDFNVLLSVKDPHPRLDSVLELHAKYGDDIFTRVKLPQQWSTLEDIELASLRGKFVDYTKLRKAADAVTKQSSKLNEKQIRQRLNYTDIQKMLNLPGTPNGEIHPILLAFDSILKQGDETLTIETLDHFKRMLAEMQEDVLSPYLNREMQLRGSMLSAPTDAKPALLISRPVVDNEPLRSTLVSRSAMLRETTLDILRNADMSGAPITAAIMKDLESREVTKAAQQIDTLMEGAQAGRGMLTQQAFATRDIIAMQGAHLTNSMVTKVAEPLIGQVFDPFVPAFSKIRGANNEADLGILALYTHARRMGWDVLEETVEEGEHVFFKLEQNAKNQKLYKRLYNEVMPEGDVFMPAPTRMKGGKREYMPLAMSGLAMEAAHGIQTMGRQALQESNVLKRAHGVGETQLRNWWVPPKNLSRQETVFLVTEAGELRTMGHGRTKSEAERMAQQIIEVAEEPLIRVDSRDMEKYFNLQDAAFERHMVDFSDAIAQTKKATGKSVDPDVIATGGDVLDDMIASINKQLQSVPRRTIATYFEPQINQARLLYNASRSDKRESGQLIYQQYVAALFGNQTLSPNDIFGKTYLGIESIYDKHINALYDKVHDAAMPAGFKRQRTHAGEDKTYAKLQDELGEFNPFGSAVDYMERTYQASLPPSMKKHMAKLTSLTSLLTLRLFETGHAVLNLTSLAATMPGVIKALQKMPGETTTAWQARTASFGSPMIDGVGQFSASRAITSAMHDIFNKPGFFREAAKAGYFKQDVAEIMHTLTAPREGYAAGLVRKYTDLFSIISDKSEELSRAISFATGYHIAERGHRMTNKPDMFAFAHKFANEVIGDYRPSNRPRLFQGAVGMPIGLFQTFAWNYFQRLFGYVENKQLGALGVQYATQAAVFGASTVPGFKQFNEFFASNYDGTVNPVDGLYNRFGQEGVDWFLYGTLSNLPKLFGSDDGIGLTSRGDMNMHRVPGLWNIEDTPVFSMLSKGAQFTAGVFENLKTNQGLNTQQLLETAANYSMWRTGKNMIEIGLGYSTDKRGQMVNADTQSGVSIAARIMGMRPLREQKELTFWNRMRNTQFSQRELRMELRDSVRASVRAGDYSDDVFETTIRQYLKSGGKPEGIASWMAEQAATAQVERAQNEVMKTIRNPNRARDTKRLIEILSLPQNDPAIED